MIEVEHSADGSRTRKSSDEVLGSVAVLCDAPEVLALRLDP